MSKQYWPSVSDRVRDARHEMQQLQERKRAQGLNYEYIAQAMRVFDQTASCRNAREVARQAIELARYLRPHTLRFVLSGDRYLCTVDREIGAAVARDRDAIIADRLKGGSL